jgi:hypothetical protein
MNDVIFKNHTSMYVLLFIGSHNQEAIFSRYMKRICDFEKENLEQIVSMNKAIDYLHFLKGIEDSEKEYFFSISATHDKLHFVDGDEVYDFDCFEMLVAYSPVLNDATKENILTRISKIRSFPLQRNYLKMLEEKVKMKLSGSHI